MKLLLPLALLVSGCNLASCSPDQQVSESLQSFRQPKNIAFCVSGGGSSHIEWVLSIMEELSNRGHVTTFLTRDSHKKFGKKFPVVETVSLGDDSEYLNAFKEFTVNNRQSTLASLSITLLKAIKPTFEEDYLKTLELFKSRKIDVALCDHFTTSCQEACHTLRIPFLVTSSIAAAPDTEAPYIDCDDLYMRHLSNLEKSFFERVYDKLIVPVKVFLNTFKLVQEQKRRHLALGIKDPVFPHEERWKDSIKLFNTAFGFESARPLGPLVELIGPIIPKTAASVLPENMDQFLKTHQRVAYIAFGQHAVTNESELTLLLAGLLEAYEEGDIDGMIWSTRGLDGIIPSVITTRSNTTYDLHPHLHQDEFGDFAFLQWAPQTAILQHPSTTVFVTHAGAGSLYEGLQAGKRLILYPFFADQPRNSHLAEKFGLGLRVDYKGTRDEAAQIVQRVAKDVDGFFQSNVNRFQALVQIRSQTGITNGANLVEEVAFMHQDTVLHHRRDVKHDLSFIVAHNLDVYMFGLVMICLPLFVGIYTLNSFFSRAEKVKTQ
ncbi:hypothetical protein PS15p_210984 [Mucor circinelloides]